MSRWRLSQQPLVSVVMPVYNASPFLADATESILTQTYRHFEFIIVDDGSTDKSRQILQQYAQKDKRVIILKNRIHQGVSKTVKKAINHARGKLIARMDADDIALPDRLAKQTAYLKQHPATVAVGGQCLVIDEKGNEIGKKTFPTDHISIYRSMFAFFPIQEPTLMIARHRLPKGFVFYAKNGNIAEEVELIFKLFRYGAVENMPDVLLQYRLHANNSSLKNVRQTFYLTLKARLKAVFFYGYLPTLKDVFTTLLQLLIVTFLPQQLTLFLYQQLRRLSNTEENPRLKPHHSFVSS